MINPRRHDRFTRPGAATMLPVGVEEGAGGLHAPIILRGFHRRMVFGLAALPARRRRRPGADRPLEPDHGCRRRRHGALPVAGLDRAAWLHHAARHLSPADDGAALVLAAVLQFADAAFDLLPWRLCHSRHL